MDQQASRAREILALLESKAATSARDEVTKIKSALRPPPPSQAQLVAAWDRMAMGNLGSGTPEDLERRRAEHENARLAEMNSRGVEERTRQAADKPWR